MAGQRPPLGAHVVLEKPALQHVFDALAAAGYTVVGPRVRDGAIVYDVLQTTGDLPIGWTDDQAPGRYQVRRRDDGRYFGFTLGPHAWKRFLYPPVLRLFSTRRTPDGFEVLAPGAVEPGLPPVGDAADGEAPSDGAPRYAFVGVRACELAAIAIQDRVFLESGVVEPHYRARRAAAFLLAVNCLEPGALCFCASTKTGPRCTAGFDLALTELDEIFVVEVGSELGAQMLDGAPWRPAGAFELSRQRRALAEAQDRMGRQMDTRDLPDLLYENLEHPRWAETAARCLSCANCTMVCPTCFCADVRDISDLTGERASRVRVWDSCFTREFSYIHGGHLRPNVRARYRQWLTHKLASWIDQFGTLGCVGCGRCIAWCPAGIDLTEELVAIRGERAS